jgi:hypothetical protein
MLEGRGDKIGYLVEIFEEAPLAAGDVGDMAPPLRVASFRSGCFEPEPDDI